MRRARQEGQAHEEGGGKGQGELVAAGLGYGGEGDGSRVEEERQIDNAPGEIALSYAEHDAGDEEEVERQGRSPEEPVPSGFGGRGKECAKLIGEFEEELGVL